jgi:hypothetical protein
MRIVYTLLLLCGIVMVCVLVYHIAFEHPKQPGVLVLVCVCFIVQIFIATYRIRELDAKKKP